MGGIGWLWNDTYDAWNEAMYGWYRVGRSIVMERRRIGVVIDALLGFRLLISVE